MDVKENTEHWDIVNFIGRNRMCTKKVKRNRMQNTMKKTRIQYIKQV